MLVSFPRFDHALRCDVHVTEHVDKVPRCPPRRAYNVSLVRPRADITSDDILALAEIPEIGEIHVNPVYHVSKRGAVKIGPARWGVWIHYTRNDGKPDDAE